MSSKIRIENYNPAFLKAQFSLGQRLSSHWPHYFQIRPEKLEEIYNQENFDPSTRFYAFCGEKLVGFVSSAFEAENDNFGKNELMTMQFPFADPIVPGVQEMLMNHVISTARNNDSKVLRIRLGDNFDNILSTKEFVEKYGFTLIREDDDQRARLMVDEVIESSIQNLVVEDFNYERDNEDVIEMILQQYDYPEETVRRNITTWKNLEEGTDCLVIREGDQVIAQGILFWKIDNPGAAVVGHIKVKDEFLHREYRDEILYKMIQRCKENGIEELLIYVPKNIKTANEMYSNFSLKFSRYFFYELNL